MSYGTELIDVFIYGSDFVQVFEQLNKSAWAALSWHRPFLVSGQIFW